MIEMICPRNDFSIQQKRSLNFLIDNILKENVEVGLGSKKDVGIMLLYIGNLYDNHDLLQWVLDNNFANIHDFLNKKHFEILLRLGFPFDEKHTCYQ